MGRIFISTGNGGWGNGYGYSEARVIDRATTVQATILLRDLVVQNLRSRHYNALAVPDDLSLAQTIAWINNRMAPGDIALELYVIPKESTDQGVAVFYIAHNEQRKAHADHLLQAYLQRVPQILNRGAKPDTQTLIGNVPFCRQVMIPALWMEIGFPMSSDQDQSLQNQSQSIALGLAEGLATWSRSVASASGTMAPYPTIEISLNGAIYDDEGISVDGNAYIPMDLVDQLGIELLPDSPIRRLDYRHIVYVRAIDLRDFNIAIRKSEDTQTVLLQSILPIGSGQIDRLMGRGNTSEVQMMMFVKSHHPDGLTRFSDLPKLYREEGAIEGINHDIAFAQMCIETNFLRFDKAIKPEQNNFARLGTVRGGIGGASFSSARLGVRAQIQHLKAYANTEPLVQAIVDPRFQLVRRGIAPSVHQLSGRWTADSHYSHKILSVLRRLYESAGFL
ncbi:MAG: cell wall hydrolase [Cyanobacteria bacterium CRU_2_1]|nr:cell wall hydrolase [Cyanobacteria bacterium RU_5_0]NJR58464.1 cell wall hydrolase [Cyanobacteria bacterium CRU_2_1]